MNLDNTEEEVDVTCINYKNELKNVCINDDSNYSHKYYAPFNCQTTTNIYP